MHRSHALLSFALPLSKLQQSRRSFINRNFSRQKSRWKTFMNSPKIYLVLVYTGREGIAGWWAYELISPTPQSASDAPKKKRNVDKKRRVLVLYGDSSKNIRTTYVRELPIDGAVKNKPATSSMRKSISNDLEPHFQASATKSRCVERARKLLSLRHTLVRAPKIPSQGGELSE